MYPPIPPGTLLQGQYRLLRLLQQEQIRRTYLAEQQEQSGQHCLIQEYSIPLNRLQSLQEVWQREVNLLSQLQHPQLPQIRALFEQGQRLFLVQEYFEGTPYSTLLAERQSTNQTFSEAEVSRLLQQLLPVLTYLHGQGITHQAISSQTLLLRDRDLLPVLTDIGTLRQALVAVLPELAATEGAWIAPHAPEDRASPIYDLYHLGITLLLLLTGKTTEELWNPETQSWNWQEFAPTVTPEFARLLNRIIHLEAPDRLTSAPAVARALRALTPATAPASGNPRSRQARSAPTPKPVAAKSQDSFWFWGIIGVGLMAIVGLPILLIRFTAPRPTVVINPPATDNDPTNTAVAPEPLPPSTNRTESAPNPNPSPGPNSEPINLSGNGATVASRVSPQEPKRYSLTIPPGQVGTLKVATGAVALNLRKPTGEAIQNGAGVSSWQSTVQEQPNEVQIEVVAALETDFTLEVRLGTPASPNPSPNPTVSPGDPVNPSPSPNLSPSPTATASPSPVPSPTTSPSPVPSASPTPSSSPLL